MHTDQKGFGLIELIIVLVILGLVGVTLLAGVNAALEGTAKIQHRDMAINLAQGRMAFVMGQFEAYGFAVVSDPCASTPSLAICAVPSGYNLSSTITSNWSGNSNYKLVTVQVSGLASTTLTTLVANYQ